MPIAELTDEVDLTSTASAWPTSLRLLAVVAVVLNCSTFAYNQQVELCFAAREIL